MKGFAFRETRSGQPCQTEKHMWEDPELGYDIMRSSAEWDAWGQSRYELMWLDCERPWRLCEGGLWESRTRWAIGGSGKCTKQSPGPARQKIDRGWLAQQREPQTGSSVSPSPGPGQPGHPSFVGASRWSGLFSLCQLHIFLLLDWERAAYRRSLVLKEKGEAEAKPREEGAGLCWEELPAVRKISQKCRKEAWSTAAWLRAASSVHGWQTFGWQMSLERPVFMSQLPHFLWW